MLHPVYDIEQDAAGRLQLLSRPGGAQQAGNIAFELYFIEREEDPQALEALSRHRAGVNDIIGD